MLMRLVLHDAYSAHSQGVNHELKHRKAGQILGSKACTSAESPRGDKRAIGHRLAASGRI